MAMAAAAGVVVTCLATRHCQAAAWRPLQRHQQVSGDPRRPARSFSSTCGRQRPRSERVQADRGGWGAPEADWSVEGGGAEADDDLDLFPDEVTARGRRGAEAPPPLSLARPPLTRARRLAARSPPPPPPPQQQGPEPEFWVQNLLAVGLLAVLALSAGNVVFKLVIVALSLISAALRYCILAILLMVVLARWGVDREDEEEEEGGGGAAGRGAARQQQAGGAAAAPP